MDFLRVVGGDRSHPSFPFSLLCRFVRGLALLHNDFRGHMTSANRAHEKQVISEEMLRVILSNIGSLYTINSGLLAELEQRIAKWCVGFSVHHWIHACV